MGFDIHRFGSYLATDAAHNRLPYAFDWSWPVMTAGYRAHLQAGLEPEKYADELWELSRHTLTIGWYDLDTADLIAAINEAVLAIAPTVRWYVTAAGTTETYSCLVRDVEHSEAYEVDVDGRRGTAVDFILTCTPGWESSEVEVELASPGTYPCVYEAAGVLGSMPAPFRLALTNDQAVTGGTLGFRHMPHTPGSTSVVAAYDFEDGVQGWTFGTGCGRSTTVGLEGSASIYVTQTTDAAVYATGPEFPSALTGEFRVRYLHRPGSAIGRNGRFDLRENGTARYSVLFSDGRLGIGAPDFVGSYTAGKVYEVVIEGDVAADKVSSVSVRNVTDGGTATVYTNDGEGFAFSAATTSLTDIAIYAYSATGSAVSYFDGIEVQAAAEIALDPDFTPLQDYQGTAVSMALSGEAAVGTMDADGTALGTPATLDTNVMRGWYYACARLQQPDTTPADTTYKAVSTVTGSGMGGTQASESDAVAATATNVWEHVRLGPVPIPGGAVPDIETGSGWSAEAALLDQTDATSSLNVSAERTLEGEAVALYFYQTYTASGRQRLTAFEFEVLTAPATTTGWTLEVIHYDGWDLVLDRSVPIPSMEAGTHKVAFSDLETAPASEYTFRVSAPLSAVLESLVVAASSTSVYAGGTAGESSVGDVAKDLTCAVYGTVPLGFNSTVAVIAANAGGGSAALDTVALVPADEFALLADTAHGTNEGMMVDAMDPDEVTVYGTNTAGGVEPADQEDVEYTGVPRIWPGLTAIVYDAHTPQAATPLAGDAKLWYKPTYRTPYGA